MNRKEFIKFKKRSKVEFKKIKAVYCPYFKSEVIFNSKGFEHIKFKSRHQARPIKEQYIRLKYLPSSIEVIRKSNTLQGIRRCNEMVAVKHGAWKYKMKNIQYYEFIAVLDDIRIRVIVRKIASGDLHFWSIIPFWKKDKVGHRMLHNGNPSED